VILKVKMRLRLMGWDWVMLTGLLRGWHYRKQRVLVIVRLRGKLTETDFPRHWDCNLPRERHLPRLMGWETVKLRLRRFRQRELRV
jgi:hypothetical protein